MGERATSRPNFGAAKNAGHRHVCLNDTEGNGFRKFARKQPDQFGNRTAIRKNVFTSALWNVCAKLRLTGPCLPVAFEEVGVVNRQE